MFVHIFFFILSFFSISFSMDQEIIHDSFEVFNKKCVLNLPTYKQLFESHLDAFDETDTGLLFRADLHHKYRLISAEQFEDIQDQYLNLVEASLTNVDLWCGNIQNLDPKKRFTVSKRQASLLPYAQKMIVDKDNLIFFRGDMHGDIHSLMSLLRNFQIEGLSSSEDGFCITNPHLKLVFLGDYVDRGIYGAEVIYTILRLKITNPDQVILVRGNHEDHNMTLHYGFMHELRHKFGESVLKSISQKLTLIYESMPVVLYLGKQVTKEEYNYLQCCHGGMEIGYNPQELLASEKKYEFIPHLNRKTEYEKLTQPAYEEIAVQSYCELQSACKYNILYPLHGQHGFMWNDFHLHAKDILKTQCDRGICYDASMTKAVLERASSDAHKVCGVIRAHQHAPSNEDELMWRMIYYNGVAQHWVDQKKSSVFSLKYGGVCTLLLSPDTYGAMNFGEEFEGFEFDTILCLQPLEAFENWRFTTTNKHLYSEIELLIDIYMEESSCSSVVSESNIERIDHNQHSSELSESSTFIDQSYDSSSSDEVSEQFIEQIEYTDEDFDAYETSTSTNSSTNSLGTIDGFESNDDGSFFTDSEEN